MPSKTSFHIAAVLLITWAVCAVGTSAQTKKKKATKTVAAPTVVETKAATPAPAPVVEEPVAKRNARPADELTTASGGTSQSKPDPFYRYEFTQPDFINNRITIEHDDSGKGTIVFTRRGSTEAITDPLQLSAATLARLKAAYTALNFHDSTENYQYEKDFSHLGVIKISLTKGGRERATTFNYTTNKNAKVLMDEYRKISNQWIWIFDMTVARENQPLDGPTQMETLDAYIKRGEIADPEQMLPLLHELTDDERLPLIARNHAARLIKQIEKAKK